MSEIESLVALNMVEGLGPITIRRLVNAFGSASAAFAADSAALARVEGIGPVLAARIAAGRSAADAPRELERARRGGVTLIPFTDPAYPECLAEIYDPPVLLYVKGALRPEDRFSIAVVGARRCSQYGLFHAERLAGQIAGVGLTVVSGMARGIDTAAHRGAIKAGGRTIAVLGSGLGRIYPPENRGLADEIAATGAVVSEFPLAIGPQRANFPLRNRLISGLSLGVLVVEAARKSGSLITASQALEQGRTVFAMPGRIDSFASRGAHALLKDGARLVESVEDICAEFPYLFPARAPREETGAPGAPRPRLTPGEESVLGHLAAEERSIDEITASCGLPPAAVSAALLSLELKHLANKLPGNRFRKAF